MKSRRTFCGFAGVRASVTGDRRVAAVHAGIEARKAQQFAAKREQLQAELTREELRASKAAMMANVPTIQFPEDDPKYKSARKHEQA